VTAARSIAYCVVAALIGFSVPGPALAASTVCLAVVNTTSQSFNFTVDGYNQYNWLWGPNEELKYVSVNGVDIKSPNDNGAFTVRGYGSTIVNSQNTTFVFHQEMTGGQGQVGSCNGTWVMTIHYPGAAPAPAPVPTPPSDGMNHDHPGACLYVKNTTGSTITIKVTYPHGYENVHWEYPPGDNALLASNSVALTSADGGWSINTSPNLQGTWTYNGAYTQDGCNGEWIFTM
jgi:hypothetical protein